MQIYSTHPSDKHLRFLYTFSPTLCLVEFFFFALILCCCIIFNNSTTFTTNTGLLDNGVAICFTGGAQGLAILAVTAQSYPDRIAFSGLIEDTKDRFLSKGYMWSSVNKGGLSGNRKFGKDLKDLCSEYDDVNAKDKIARLRTQVAVVQSTMQNNISKALENLESTERLEEQSTNLVASSDKFNRSAKKLAWKEVSSLVKFLFYVFRCSSVGGLMSDLHILFVLFISYLFIFHSPQWCMLMKMRMLVVFVILAIIGIIIAVICGAPDACQAADTPAVAPGVSPAAAAGRL